MRRGSAGRCHIKQTYVSLRELHRAPMRIPAYQRALVWGVEQRQLFLDRLADGFPIGGIWLYEKVWREPLWLLDGQQRLSCLEVPMSRAGEAVAATPPLYLDLDAYLEERRPYWRAEDRDGLALTPSRLAGPIGFLFDGALRARIGEDRLDELLLLMDRWSGQPVMATIAEALTPEEEREMFRILNTGGTPMQAEEVEKLVGSAASL